MSAPTLTPQELDDAWLMLFRFNADQLGDHELRWESARWAYLGCPWLAAVSTHVLAERQEDGIEMVGPPCARGLDGLWSALDPSAVLAFCAAEAQPIVTSMRVAYWVGKSVQHD